MREKKKDSTKSTRRSRVRRAFPYLVISVLVIALAFFGSQDKFRRQDTSVDMRAISEDNFSASADQVSEMYIVSNLASSMQSPSAAVSKINYDTITSAMSYTSSTSTEKLEKPIVDASNLGYGVVKYTVGDGETVASIAAKYAASGVTEEMVRWSNGLKNDAAINPGQVLYVPGRAGFVHRVKKDETLQTLATKYQSSVDGIVASNNLEENETVAEGMMVLIPDGVMPENEKPDYKAPVAKRSGRSTYSYYAQYSSGNKYAYGWCTWYAWSRRRDLPGNMGNANMWARNAARAGYSVNKSPRAGDVFQTGAGWYGHVGYVESVNGDGSITISDMNGRGGWGRVWTGTISASEWRSYNFIHRR